MLSFCPWEQSALDRSPSLYEWWCSIINEHLEFLNPKDWSSRGHDHSGLYKDTSGFRRLKTQRGIFVWSPPAAAADTEIEELRKARLKIQHSLHIVLIPCLFTYIWLKQLSKCCDIVFAFEFWNTNMCEPLCVGVSFPFLSYSPWQLQRTPTLLSVGRELRKGFKKTDMDPRDILRKFFFETRKLSTLFPSLVWKLLYFRPKRDFSSPFPVCRHQSKRIRKS